MIRFPWFDLAWLAVATLSVSMWLHFRVLAWVRGSSL